MSLESGTKLGSYEISDLLGKGGMGEVYRARDTKLGREVAIKVLPSEFSQDEERLARLEREARMLAALNHPNIAAIHGLEETDDTRFLVLELVEGDTLADRLKRGAIPVEESLGLALQIAEALEAAHEKGVIHRDLKPANIKITPEGRVKVLDFGLAKALTGDQEDVNLSNSPTLSMRATQAGIILGTAAYMSPEQARGRTVDDRTDVWAFGCVLYEMLTGRSAFAGDDISLTLARVLERDPDFSTLPPNLHPKVRRLLERCLEKPSRNRYHGISDARVDLEKVLADPSGPLLEPITDASEARPQSNRQWVAAILLAAITAFGMWFFMQPTPEPPVRLTAVHPGMELVSNLTDQDVLVSPDGLRLIYVAVTGDGVSGGLYMRSLDRAEPTLLAESTRSPFLSPDGQWVGFTAGEAGPWMKVAVSGGPPVRIGGGGATPRGATWGPEDVIVFATSDVSTGLSRIPAGGGEAEVVTTPDATRGERDHVFPEFLPDGRAVLFTITSADASATPKIAILDPNTGGYRVLIEDGAIPRYAPTGHIVYVVQGSLLAVPFDLSALEVRGTPVPIFDGVTSSNFSISAEGTLVYLAGGATGAALQSLVWVDRIGGREALDLPPDRYRMPRISPDGTRLAVETGGSEGSTIWTYDLAGDSGIQRLTLDGNNFRPVWTPDGERITFASDRAGPVSIYWQQADGGGVAEPLTVAEEGTAHWPNSWSPDGTLAFTVERVGSNTPNSLGNEMEIWTVARDRLDEPEILSAAQYPLQEFLPEFSPDGEWLAYSAGDASAFEWNVYVRPSSGLGERRQISLGGGGRHAWSADGSELIYRPGLRLEMLRSIGVSTGAAFSLGIEEEWPIEGLLWSSYYRNWDISPGGRFLVIVDEEQRQGGSATGRQINVVLNWFEELKERVPVP